MIIYTNAPPAYDYSYAIEISKRPNGTRVVLCDGGNASYQMGRYMSGLYWVTTDRSIAKDYDPNVETVDMDTFMDMDRDEILELLQWNDPNGIWTDTRSRDEGFPPTTFQVAARNVLSWIKEDPDFDLDAFINRFRAERAEVA